MEETKKNKHMTLQDRIEIQECLSKSMTFKAIGKRNCIFLLRIPYTIHHPNNPVCLVYISLYEIRTIFSI